MLYTIVRFKIHYEHTFRAYKKNPLFEKTNLAGAPSTTKVTIQNIMFGNDITYTLSTILDPFTGDSSKPTVSVGNCMLKLFVPNYPIMYYKVVKTIDNPEKQRFRLKAKKKQFK